MLDEAGIEARQRRLEEGRQRIAEAVERAEAPQGVAPQGVAPAPGLPPGTLNSEVKEKAMATPQQIKDRAEAAAKAFEERKAKLYRKDGTQLYGPEEHKERLGEIARERDAALDRLIEEAAEERRKAEAKAESLKRPDVTASLTEAELASANSRYTFISEEVMELSKDDLLSRIGVVLESGDRASIFAHARATRKRAASDHEKRGAAARRAGTGRVVVRSVDLTEAAERLEDKLAGGSRKERIAEAKERAKEYMSAEMRVGGVRRPYRPNYFPRSSPQNEDLVYGSHS